MAGTSFGRGIRSLTECREKISEFVDIVQREKEPITLTRHGRGVAVLIGADEYASLIDELERLRDVRTAERELEFGERSTHQAVATRLRAQMGR